MTNQKQLFKIKSEEGEEIIESENVLPNPFPNLPALGQAAALRPHMNRFLQNHTVNNQPTNPFIAGLQNQILQAALQRQKMEDDQKRINQIHPAFRPPMPNLSIFPFGPVSIC